MYKVTFRKEVFIPELMDRNNYRKWASQGSKTLKDRAKEKVQWILENHNPEAVSEALRNEIKEIVDKTDRMRQLK